MSFFIPGRTRCALCDEPIAQRADAAQLPFVSPSVLPEWAKLSRAFVLRRCWEHWPHRDTYAWAARELVLSAPEQPAQRRRFEHEGLFLFEVPAVKGFRILDTWAPLTVDVPGQDAARLASAVLDAFAHRTALAQDVGPTRWTLDPTGSDGWVLTLSQEGEPFECLELPAARQVLWTELMTELLRSSSSGTSP